VRFKRPLNKSRTASRVVRNSKRRRISPPQQPLTQQKPQKPQKKPQQKPQKPQKKP
jgi:hypothetical protein